MTTATPPHPPIVSRDQWTAERKKLLEEEKELTRQYDRLNARRRRLPMVKIEKNYRFDGPDGNQNLLDLFDHQRQLIVYHFMFDPAWDKGCPGCTGFVNALGDLSMLKKRDTTFILISRAPLPKLKAYKDQNGWTLPWFSSFGSDFNYDFHVTLDKKIAPVEFNYREKAQLETKKEGEEHGLSVYFRRDNDLFHTYSTFARGTESLTDAYRLLDLTPYGRQEDFEVSPQAIPKNQPTAKLTP